MLQNESAAPGGHSVHVLLSLSRPSPLAHFLLFSCMCGWKRLILCQLSCTRPWGRCRDLCSGVSGPGPGAVSPACSDRRLRHLVPNPTAGGNQGIPGGSCPTSVGEFVCDPL